MSDVELTHAPPWYVDGHVMWSYLIPRALDYDNTRGCESTTPCLDTIEYDSADLTMDGRSGRRLSNAIVSKHVTGEGTYLFRSSDRNGAVLHRIAVRRGDTYIGHVSELIGVPFVYYPSNEQGLGHQTDRGIGADCVATLIYGMRRIGRPIPYVAPRRLYDYTRKIGDNTSLETTHVEVSDIVHFGFQTAVISEDEPPVGILSDQDKVIHSYHGYVEEVEFGRLPYREMPFDVLRWNL